MIQIFRKPKGRQIPVSVFGVTSLWGPQLFSRLLLLEFTPPVVRRQPKAEVWLHACFCNHNSSFPPWNRTSSTCLSKHCLGKVSWDLGTILNFTSCEIFFFPHVISAALWLKKQQLLHESELFHMQTTRSPNQMCGESDGNFFRLYLRTGFFRDESTLSSCVRLLCSDFLCSQQGSPDNRSTWNTRESVFYYWSGEET